MKKKHPKQIELRRQKRKKAKRERLILALSALPSFVFTVLLTILYAFKITYLWLFATTSGCWLALGGLYLYAYKQRWGYVSHGSGEADEGGSVATVYNIIIIFTLAVLFLTLLFRRLF